MQLQHYLAINKKKGIFFGEHEKQQSWDFDWHISNNRIGITGNPSTEAECFIGGFFLTNDRLLLMPSTQHPIIRRENSPYAHMADRNDAPHISALIALLQSQDETYAFLSSRERDGRLWSPILTFSKTPPGELYVPGKKMQIAVEPQAEL